MPPAPASEAASTDSIRNHLLAALAPDDLARLRPHLEPAALSLGKAPTEPGRPIAHVLFPEAGIVSLLAVTPDKRRRIEAGMIGREGMVGLPVVLGTGTELHETVVQADMRGWQLQSDMLRRAMAESPALHGVLLRYIQTFMAQTAHTLLANTTRRMDERLARWLLMTRDRLDGDDLPLTQTFLSNMLGANRPGITLAVRALGAAGLIRHVRGRITVLDRAGLEAAAGGSYGTPEAEYARLFGSSR
jgi:CRP-like cAMP-binding protein